MFNNQFAMQPQGLMYNNQMKQPLMTQGLTPAQIAEMKRKSSTALNLSIPEVEFLSQRCTHRENGVYTLVENPDGSVTCGICGENFDMLNVDSTQAKEIIRQANNLFQSAKVYHTDISEPVIQQLSQVVPVMKRFDAFYENAVATFNKYDQNPYQQQPGQFGFNAFNAIMNPATTMMPMGMMPGQMPMGQMSMGQMPMGQMSMGMMPGQMPMGTMQMGMMPGQMSNGFGFNGQVPMQQYDPQQQMMMGQQVGQQTVETTGAAPATTKQYNG